MKLTDEQRATLAWLVTQGGSGYIDRYGRVVAGGEVRAQGAWISWLKMVAAGLIEGHDDRLAITPLGRLTLSRALINVLDR